MQLSPQAGRPTHRPSCITGRERASRAAALRVPKNTPKPQHCCASMLHGNRAPVASAAKPKLETTTHLTHHSRTTSRKHAGIVSMISFRSDPCCIRASPRPPLPKNARSAGCAKHHHPSSYPELKSSHAPAAISSSIKKFPIPRQEKKKKNRTDHLLPINASPWMACCSPLENAKQKKKTRKKKNKIHASQPKSQR